MPQVIDSLIVKLAFDGSKMAKGAKDAQKGVEGITERTEKAGNAAKKAGKEGADAFAAFRREALGALALFTGGRSLMGFTKDVTQANVALGNLSRQLDIAPQKLSQLHSVAQSVNVNPGDVDSFLKNLQRGSVDPSKRAELANIGQQLGVNFFDEKNHVRSDIIEQLNKSDAVRKNNRAWVDTMIGRAGGSEGITTIATQNDLSKRLGTYADTGPTKEDIEAAQQMLSDWTELKANTDKIARKALTELEPTVHTWVHALIAFERAHPKGIAHGLEFVTGALTALSAVLTARGFMSTLRLLSGIGGGASSGAAVAGGVGRGVSSLGAAGAGAWAADSFFHSNISHRITNSIAEGEKYVKETWGLNKAFNDLLQRDIDRRHALVQNNGGLLDTAGVALKEWGDILTTGEEALLGTSLSPSQGSKGALSRGERNHNPGNIRFAGQRGAIPEDPNHPDHTFAVFKSDEDGVRALQKQLTLYNKRDHLDTVSAMISKYAPASDHNKTQDYIEHVSRALRVGKNQHLGALSPNAMAAIMHGIIGVETGGHDHYGKMVERIAGLSNAASFASAQNTTHTTTNTTHAPVVNVHVANSNAHPHDIAHAVSTKLAQTLAGSAPGHIG